LVLFFATSDFSTAGGVHEPSITGVFGKYHFALITLRQFVLHIDRQRIVRMGKLNPLNGS